jgi:hypothetical protein
MIKIIPSQDVEKQSKFTRQTQSQYNAISKQLTSLLVERVSQRTLDEEKQCNQSRQMCFNIPPSQRLSSRLAEKSQPKPKGHQKNPFRVWRNREQSEMSIDVYTITPLYLAPFQPHTLSFDSLLRLANEKNLLVRLIFYLSRSFLSQEEETEIEQEKILGIARKERGEWVSYANRV